MNEHEHRYEHGRDRERGLDWERHREEQTEKSLIGARQISKIPIHQASTDFGFGNVDEILGCRQTAASWNIEFDG